MKIYVASSWRNKAQPYVVAELRHHGHDVYDFRNPGGRDPGFHWSEIDPDWRNWTPEEFKNGLEHPLAESGFSKDFTAMMESDMCVLVCPCGRSAHLEAGYFVGADKPLFVMTAKEEPELMYKMATNIHHDILEIIEYIRVLEKHKSDEEHNVGHGRNAKHQADRLQEDPKAPGTDEDGGSAVL